MPAPEAAVICNAMKNMFPPPDRRALTIIRTLQAIETIAMEDQMEVVLQNQEALPNQILYLDLLVHPDLHPLPEEVVLVPQEEAVLVLLHQDHQEKDNLKKIL